ncbi:aspartate/glutamate racemase family protein [Anaeromassilibacillus senegalensis]|uniref:Amino acid racemase n=1 Tax=Anaeromassilibacillus senegalensis TaxID=1673717 RepID=A0ABS9CMA1_9FIRM|nr:amino acid racemase [Anaeromassilibacillus senegalensis]MCF2651972.1 amino acid racemase [Anaeromassilibacillus senegalensis]
MNSFGIIGGLGPMATAYLLELIIDMTDAKTDQEHLDAIIFNRPSVPDRTAYILDHSKPSPVPPMIDMAKKLEALGVCAIGTPCVTAHSFHEELQRSVNVPFINMVQETAAYLKNAGCKKAGIMATTGTVHNGLFQRALSEIGLSYALPDDAMQQYVMSLIYDCVKAGEPADMEKFRTVSDALRKEGCDAIILGCTELSIIKRDNAIGSGYLDALEVLAHAAILACGKKIKPKYISLLN